MTVAVFSADCLTFFPGQSPAHNPQAFARAALRLPPRSHLSVVKEQQLLKSAGNSEGRLPIGYEPPERLRLFRFNRFISVSFLRNRRTHTCLKVKNEMDRISVGSPCQTRLLWCCTVWRGPRGCVPEDYCTACHAERRVAFTSFEAATAAIVCLVVVKSSLVLDTHWPMEK